MNTSDIAETLGNLVADSTEHHYSPYTRFKWVDELQEQQWWMTPELLTVAGTAAGQALDEEQLMRLSKWEAINFFSLNIHGIRELLIEVTRRIHTVGFELPSEFFHRFLGEENGHMWFFAQFCRRYGGKIYPDKSFPIGTADQDPGVSNFLVFARILIFEELVDHFNLRMGRDVSLHPLIRDVNQVHHDDEWRHIIMGRKLVGLFYDGLRDHDKEVRDNLDLYLRRYIVTSAQSLYNPAVYRDAGIQEPYQFRESVLNDPARAPYHETFFKRITGFLTSQEIISASPFTATEAS
ncbi:MAG: diiron oxygenase [Streptosporangiaceae bacterium]